MTLLDRILLYLLGTILLTALAASLVKNVAAAIFIAILLVILLRSVFIHIFNRKRNKSVISVSEFENELSLMAGEQVNYFLSAVPHSFTPTKQELGFTYVRNSRTILVAPNYKFSQTSMDDVARFYRTAKKIGVSAVTVLGRYPTRSVLVFAGSLDISFTFLTSKKVHKFLRSQNALMPKRRSAKTRKKIKPSRLFAAAFTRERAKYFLISGLSLSFFAFIGPARAYYLVFCGICFCLAIVCLLKKT